MSPWTTRQGEAIVGVARRLLPVPVGDQIPTVTELETELRVGSGTVQAALRSLREAAAIELSSHGHRGTKLVDRNLAALWEATGGGAIQGVLPLPTSPEFSGLATGLAEAFERAGVRLNLTFRQGVRYRLAALEEGRVDFVVCSAPSARALGGAHRAVYLPQHTFYARDAVVVITRSGEKPDPRGRVPIDHNSRDHSVLTEAEFPDATLADAPYTLIPELVVHGEADAAIWHRTSASPLLTASGLDIHPRLRPPPPEGDEISRAALVMRADDAARTAVLEAVVDPAAIAEVQRQVLERKRVPGF
jgi:YhfZ C-terminal domain/Helix-turn-helix domain